MRKSGVLLLVCMLALAGRAAVIDTIRVHATKMNQEVAVVVVVPEGSKEKTFPVLYLLHGHGGNAETWVRHMNVTEFADRYGMILVCPDGKKSWYWDSPRHPDSQYETFVSKELIAHIDSLYPTVSHRSGRAITGFSMGGHGALWNAFRHPDVFGAAGSMSGGVDIRPFPNNWDMKVQLGERDLYSKVWDSYTVINQLTGLRASGLRIFFDCGVDDFFFAVNNALHQKMLKEKIDHEYVVRPGKHDWEYWRDAIEYQGFFFRRYFDESRK